MVYLDTCILLGIYVLNWKTRGIYLPWTKTGQNPVLVGVRCRSKHHPQFLALPFSCLRDHLGCGACGPMFCSRAALVSPTGFFRVDRRVSNGRRRRYGQEGSTKFRPLGPGRSKKKTTNESDHSGSLLPPWRVRTDMTSMFFFSAGGIISSTVCSSFENVNEILNSWEDEGNRRLPLGRERIDHTLGCPPTQDAGHDQHDTIIFKLMDPDLSFHFPLVPGRGAS